MADDVLCLFLAVTRIGLRYVIVALLDFLYVCAALRILHECSGFIEFIKRAGKNR